MNCTSLIESLSTIDPTQTYQLWGLVAQENIQYCDWSSMMTQFFFLNDFYPKLTNPLYQAEIMQFQIDQIFYPVCYAYSVFRIFMVCVVFVYVYQKLKEVLGAQSRDSSLYPIQKSITISQEKNLEINIYKYAIYFAIGLELICALRDFIMFRGTLLYTNEMEEKIQPCWIDFYTDNFTCIPNPVVQTTWRSFQYQRSECNCLYKNPIAYFYSSNWRGKREILFRYFKAVICYFLFSVGLLLKVSQLELLLSPF